MYTAVKNRVFSHDMYRTRMVKSAGKVCAVHQRPCVLVPAYHPTVEVLDHDVVWLLTKFFGKIVAATIAFFSHFSARPRGNKNAATILSATLLLLPMVLVE